MLGFTLRSCVMSGLSSFGERRVVRDSLLPDSPRVKIDPERKKVNSVGAFAESRLKVRVHGIGVPVGLTLLREELRNRKLLGFWAWPGGGDVFGEDGTSDADIQTVVTSKFQCTAQEDITIWIL